MELILYTFVNHQRLTKACVFIYLCHPWILKVKIANRHTHTQPLRAACVGCTRWNHILNLPSEFSPCVLVLYLTSQPQTKHIFFSWSLPTHWLIPVLILLPSVFLSLAPQHLVCFTSAINGLVHRKQRKQLLLSLSHVELVLMRLCPSYSVENNEMDSRLCCICQRSVVKQCGWCLPWITCWLGLWFCRWCFLGFLHLILIKAVQILLLLT